MAQSDVNQFSSYTLTETELKVAVSLSPETEMYLQTLLSIQAHKKINLTYEPNNLVCLQQEAECTAKIHLLQTLLDDSRNAKLEALNDTQSPQ